MEETLYNNKMMKSLEPYFSPEVGVLCLSGDSIICESGYMDGYDVTDPWNENENTSSNLF